MTTGVRVNCICPWLVDTELLKCLKKPGSLYHSERRKQLREMHKLR